ncbi:Edc1p Ecym_1195 [Eremothecium cymbalariae DBVPG|uniref:Enhancer of mRNA-decapping protein 1 n=1 Tax=Eremothecium cymbalariae (strain CBS 270.75 / DBVPG 7215 / KCTC 17166 / NRRL Y-17582) TaxID=931890 RepID=G8JMX9_ERECY|nr:hypothetical protein Ecym_1195 [Eremothecium cymbalariae DBVPG\
MSSDTMFINSARLLPTDGKQKVKQLQKPDRKRQQRAAEQLVHQQQLPNGEKPDFGHGAKQSKKKAYSKKKRRDSDASPDNVANLELTEDLKQMLLISSKNKGAAAVVATAAMNTSSHKNLGSGGAAGGAVNNFSSAKNKGNLGLNPNGACPGYLPTSSKAASLSPLPVQPGLVGGTASGPPQLAPQFSMVLAGYQPYMQRTSVDAHKVGSSKGSSNSSVSGNNNNNHNEDYYSNCANGFMMHQHQQHLQHCVGLPAMPLYSQPLMVPQQHPYSHQPSVSAYQMPASFAYPGLPNSAGTSATNSSGLSKSAPSLETGSRRSHSRKSSQSGGSGYAGATFAADQPHLSSLPRPSFV